MQILQKDRVSIYKTNCLGWGDNKLKASAPQLVSATNQLKMIASEPLSREPNHGLEILVGDVWKNMFKFVWLLRTDAVNSLSWISDLVFIKITGFLLLLSYWIIEHLSKFLSIIFTHLTLFQLLFYATCEVLLSYIETGHYAHK